MKGKLSSFFSIFSFTTIFLTALLFFLPNTVHASEISTPENSESIQVFMDGLPLEFDVPPVIKEKRTLVPFRVIAESLHLNVFWEDTTQTIRATTPTTSLLLKIASNTAMVNGQAVSLDVPPEINDGRTLIPLRFFSENLGCTVDWLAEQQIIKINSPPQEMLVSGFYALGGGKTSSWKNLFGKDFPKTTPGNTDLVKTIALGWYSLDQKGNLLTKSTTGWQCPVGWEKVLEVANQYQLKTEMVVHMTDKESALSKLIADPIATAQAIENIINEAPLYNGVNLDLEGLGWRETGETLEKTRANFTHFVKLLYEKLTVRGLTLTLTLHAPNSAYPGYDYRSLGNNCDAIIIMAYDYGPKPEPLELVSAAVEKAAALVPAEKLILGLSIPSETPVSLPTKIGIAKRYQLKGIALWRLGLVTQEMWQVLHENILPVTFN